MITSREAKTLAVSYNNFIEAMDKELDGSLEQALAANSLLKSQLVTDVTMVPMQLLHSLIGKHKEQMI
jgi:hypothetical protein